MSEYQKKYGKTPKGVYIRQRANANRREIPWDFTFETWWKIWEDSGKWEQRGQHSSQYCMSRINDEGPYSPGNVAIITMAENSRQVCDRRWQEETEWKPYDRTSAWEYTWKGKVMNRIEE